MSEELNETDLVALDRAIRAYNKAYDVPDDWPIRDADREAFRAGVAELFDNLQPPADATDYERDMWEDTLATILRTAGLEGEG